MSTAPKKSDAQIKATEASKSVKPAKAPTKSEKTTDKSTKNTTENLLIADNTKISITLPWQTVHESYKKQLARFAKNLKTDGFRKGKVPTHIAETMVDRERLIQAVLEEIVPAAYGKEIDKGGYQPLTHPDFEPKDLTWEKDWVMEAQFAQDPKISVKEYKKIVTSAKSTAEKTWKEELAKIEKETKEAKDSKKDDKHDHDHEGHDHSGHDHGHSPAQERTPEQIEAAKKEHTLHSIFRELITTIKPAIPEMLIRENTRQEIKDLEEQLKRVNATLDQFLQQRNQQFSDLAQEMAAQTLGKLQLEFILRAIQEDLKIAVSEKEIVAEYEKLMQGLPQVAKLDEQKDGKKAETKLPPINDASREYIQRTLERRSLLDSILDLK